MSIVVNYVRTVDIGEGSPPKSGYTIPIFYLFCILLSYQHITVLQGVSGYLSNLHASLSIRSILKKLNLLRLRHFLSTKKKKEKTFSGK